MKKILVIAIIALSALTTSKAQDTKFGLVAGFLSISERAKAEDIAVSSSESGFYVGGLVDIQISEKFHVQPEVLYANVAETGFLYFPVLAKFYVADKFSLLAGPQASLFLDEVPEDFNSFGLDLTFGAVYDINEHFFVEARYGLEITNRYNGSLDITDRLNSLNVGLGYKF
ncbi:MAG: outer membrane beta-barrel protein [Gelidibacter sp.]